MDVILLYITTKDKPEALLIAHQLLKEGLIACANVLPEATSVFEWQGKVEEAPEVVMIAKTTTDMQQKTRERITALHSYDTPCVVAIKAEDAHPAFAEWIFSQTHS